MTSTPSQPANSWRSFNQRVSPLIEAIAITRDTERIFRNKGRKRIKLTELMVHLANRLEADYDREVAERLTHQTPPFVSLLIDQDGSQEKFSKRVLSLGL
jgi:hypothetical protein